MKRLIPIIVLLLLSTIVASAQTSAGTYSLTGSGYYKTNNFRETDEAETSSSIYNYISRELQISPGIGYFVLNNLEVGILGSISQNRSITAYNYQEDSSDNYNYKSFGKSITNQFAVGPFVRKYFFLTERFALTATSAFNYRFSYARNTLEYTKSQGEEINNSSDGPNSNSLSISLGAGIMYFVTGKFGITAGLGSIYYSRSSTKENRTTYEGEVYAWKRKENSGGFSFSPQYINLGLSYYFGGN
ncbi:hypothetical protein FVR03_05700 [Pontibacter qinzhouensis]|uniref:Porin family protein n=1 Tax=Pontibacter qinzhouensis TaxID=2603253 RepID=A0A5C8K8G8_9BACT|nr:hypothetical protein [Pontibacter qinzhouensis]TXK49816.1 hypothetical protein FVR03_05700 [Pontibacter qinzhouensis]